MARFNFLHQLSEACADEILRSDATLAFWLAEQRTWALGHLTTVAKEDIPALVSIVKGVNGVALLRESYVGLHSPHTLMYLLTLTLLVVWHHN